MNEQIVPRDAIERSAQLAATLGDERCPYPPMTAAHDAWQAEYQRASAHPQSLSVHASYPAPARPLARLAGMLCLQPAFRTFAGGATDAEQAASWIRQICRVRSRRDLDADPAAARRFHALVRKPYLESQK